ncbi:gluconokinase [Ramlibacter rhizophilus]|uniref:Gluconokinase n=1 Tax=Ramlibacter rhizophilus TaxID=1781167 RepID=A0A4Z0BWJ2_9BURK|nr:gluconokinase [Ramlibacter rhizophilus]
MAGSARADSTAWLVMGVSGSGKSRLAGELAQRLGARWIDADDLHPRRNLDRMAAGLPLRDEDRWPWLAAVAEAAARTSAEGPGPVFVACSALKRSYRELLRERLPGLRVLYLRLDERSARARMAQRQDHFMPAALAYSQARDLESPEGEPGVRVIEAASLSNAWWNFVLQPWHRRRPELGHIHALQLIRDIPRAHVGWGAYDELQRAHAEVTPASFAPTPAPSRGPGRRSARGARGAGAGTGPGQTAPAALGRGRAPGAQPRDPLPTAGGTRECGAGAAGRHRLRAAVGAAQQHAGGAGGRAHAAHPAARLRPAA